MQHDCAITNPLMGAETEVGTIGDQAESGKKPGKPVSGFLMFRNEIGQQDWKRTAKNGARPYNPAGMRVGRNVRSRNRERFEENVHHVPSGCQGGQRMAQFVNHQHCMPTADENPNTKHQLINAFQIGFQHSCWFAVVCQFSCVSSARSMAGDRRMPYFPASVLGSASTAADFFLTSSGSIFSIVPNI